MLEDPQRGNTLETLTYIYHILGPSFPEFIWIWGPVQAIQQIPSKDVCPKTCKSNHMGQVLHYHMLTTDYYKYPWYTLLVHPTWPNHDTT